MTGFVLDGYDPQGFYCEMLRCAATAALRQRLDHLPLADFQRRTAAAAQALYDSGITFTLYSESSAIDRILPFDPIPRVLAADEWRQIERGVIQRVSALNLLLDDVYHGQKILKDGVIPPDLILGNPNYRPSMHGAAVVHKAYVNICGTDIIRGGDGAFRGLEDNARTPSGVSYVIENRHMMLRAFPDLVDGVGLRPVEDYGSAWSQRCARSRPQALPSRRSCCCHRASTTRPISSMSSWRARWACRLSKAATSSSSKTAFTCARLPASMPSMSSTAASTTIFPTRRHSARTASSAFPG